MPKLETPVMYEETLDGLNSARPLVIGEKVDNSLDIPILNSTPVNTNNTADGRLLRCDENGVLLNCDRLIPQIDDVITFELSGDDEFHQITFPRFINHLVFYYISGDDDIDFSWVSWNGLEIYATKTPLTTWMIIGGRNRISVRGEDGSGFSVIIGCAFMYRR